MKLPGANQTQVTVYGFGFGVFFRSGFRAEGSEQVLGLGFRPLEHPYELPGNFYIRHATHPSLVINLQEKPKSWKPNSLNP